MEFVNWNNPLFYLGAHGRVRLPKWHRGTVIVVQKSIRQRNQMAAYEFTVSVRTQYLEKQSDPEHGSFVFAYSITIRNTGQVAAQLISRHWIIRDANDKVEEVKGLGVVGHQPLLQPGQQFEYTSGTSLKTPHGTMSGSYFCVAEDGTRFDAPIAEFVLSLPRTLH
jgi:ApaG protein